MYRSAMHSKLSICFHSVRSPIPFSSREKRGEPRARLEGVLESSSLSDSPEIPCLEAVRAALNICSTYPALLAAMVDEAERSADLSPIDLLHAALIGAVVDYNIQMDKTTDTYFRPEGDMIQIGTKERVEVLGEMVSAIPLLCGLQLVDTANIPSRISRRLPISLWAILKN